jgi:3-oxoacyl-[acyl-carrier-protein] synthase II
MAERRVVITGVGPVSAIGTGREAFFRGVKQGRSAIDDITLFDAEGYGCRHAAEILDFDVGPYLATPKAYLDRTAELAFASAQLAISDAALTTDDLVAAGAGLLLASAYGSLDTMATFFADVLAKGPRSAKPFLFPHTYANTPVSLLAIEFGLANHHFHFASGAIGSCLALMEAYDSIRSGKLDMALAGGYEAFHEVLHAGLDRAGLLGTSDDATPPAAPFDCARSGWTPGEGATIFVVEDRQHALARGAPIYAEISGISCVGGCPHADAAAFRSRMTEALNVAAKGVLPDYISASANGSPVLDQLEAGAIEAFLAKRAPDCPVSAPKSLTGECLGVGGAFQVAAALAGMADNFVPPTANLANPDPAVSLNLVRSSQSHHIGSALINTLDAGGSIVTIGLTRID